MRVSVIIPALNEEQYIEATLRSLRKQDFKGSWELIVADGHSSDKTVPISKKYCDKIVTETTRTIAAGRQAGARASSGELLLFTDADSLADPQWISRMARAFDDPQVAAAFGMIEPLEGGFVEKLFLHWSVLIAASLFNLLGLDYVYGSNLAMRRTAFDVIGGFNIYLHTAEDTDVIHRIRKQGKIIFVPDATVRYSTRRIRKWGYPKYLWFHTKNFFEMFLFKKPATHYEAVR